VAGEEKRLRGKAENGEQQREEAFSQEAEVKVALYARVRPHEQTAENQWLELRQYVAARGWNAIEYVDQGNRQVASHGFESTTGFAKGWS
jgi:hypothetical protein